jgi:hypothetical protein
MLMHSDASDGRHGVHLGGGRLGEAVAAEDKLPYANDNKKERIEVRQPLHLLDRPADTLPARGQGRECDAMSAHLRSTCLFFEVCHCDDELHSEWRLSVAPVRDVR